MPNPYTRVIWRISGLLCVFFLLSASSTRAQQAKGYAVHANIIYHFTKYINWPEDMRSGDFTIGVTGEPSLFAELKKVTANKTVGGQKIVVKQYSVSSNSFHCHILFVGDEASEELRRIAGKTISTSTLLVTETEGAAQHGSCINFVVTDDRLRLEFNKNNIIKRDLDIATELLQLGTIVK